MLGHERKKRILYDVIRGVQCEISKAVGEQIYLDRAHRWGSRKLEWLETWNALIDLNVKIDDSIAFSPGVSFLTPNLPDAVVWLANTTKRTVPQSYRFSVGGSIQYSPSREDMVQFVYVFEQFLKERKQLVDPSDSRPCYSIAGVTIEGDLKLSDWLDDVLEPVKKCAFLGLPLDYDQAETLTLFEGEAQQSTACYHADFRKILLGNPISTLTHQVQFVLKFDVNATPSWSLVRVSTANAPLFDANRKDTSTLLITIGPSASGKTQLTKLVWPKNAKAGVGPPPITSSLSLLSQTMLFTHQAYEIRAFGLLP
ncbi:MAG: hypothetical protein FJX15_11880 [Alphaproteobacteria bacterium]|nr:hypothetical protein [Alphaproteobacteria bacterium]